MLLSVLFFMMAQKNHWNFLSSVCDVCIRILSTVFGIVFYCVFICYFFMLCIMNNFIVNKLYLLLTSRWLILTIVIGVFNFISNLNLNDLNSVSDILMLMDLFQFYVVFLQLY
eukprot:555895_1